MIIVKLRGGLGNQMFQFAAGISLAAHHKVALKFDTAVYRRPDADRCLEIYKFNIHNEVASRTEIRCALDAFCFQQPHFHFYENFFHLPPHVYLAGFWQSEKYFAHNRQHLLAAFTLQEEITGPNQQLIDRLQSENSIGIHVRREDYVYGKHADFFKALDLSYYRAAISKMNHLYERNSFYLFSDDPAWCRQAFSGLTNCMYVDHNGNQSHFDLMLLSKCKHQIIANSTFSWWAAWLNENPTKTIVAPKQWFGKDYRETGSPYKKRFYNTKDLLPDNWIRI